MKLMAASKLDKVSHEKIRALVKDFKEFTVNVNGTQSIEKHSLLAAVYLLKKLTRKKCLLNLQMAYISAGSS